MHSINYHLYNISFRKLGDGKFLNGNLLISLFKNINKQVRECINKVTINQFAFIIDSDQNTLHSVYTTTILFIITN